MNRIALLTTPDAAAEIVTSDAHSSSEALLFYKGLLDQLARRGLLAFAIGYEIQIRPPDAEWTCCGMGDASATRIFELLQRLSSYGLEARGLGERPAPSFSYAVTTYSWTGSDDAPAEWLAQISFPSDLIAYLLHRVSSKADWIAEELFPGLNLSVRPSDPGLNSLIMVPISKRGT